MARSLRIERANGVYHVINRGNYRQDLFINDGAHQAFENCLFEACVKSGWILEGHCVMTNHFHLVLRTPQGNLVSGMKWLQSTFANRYHRYRHINGKLFQGRYKSLIVEEDSHLAALQHYVNLNPVRAGICSVKELKDYRWSSYWYLRQTKERPEFMDLSGALLGAGRLKDTPQGRQKYRAYLEWLSTDVPARKEMEFDKMCRGWALGSMDFKRALVHSEGLLKEGSTEAIRMEGRDLHEVNVLIWEAKLTEGLKAAGKDAAAIESERKSAPWKIEIAANLKLLTSAPSTWIAEHLNMGSPQRISRYVRAFQEESNHNQGNKMYKGTE